jgi:hypothetical protein
VSSVISKPRIHLSRINLSQSCSDEQDLAIRLTLGGLYFCPEVIERLLYPVEGTTKKVLDVGESILYPVSY